MIARRKDLVEILSADKGVALREKTEEIFRQTRDHILDKRKTTYEDNLLLKTLSLDLKKLDPTLTM